MSVAANRFFLSAPLFLPALTLIAGIIVGDHQAVPPFYWAFLLAALATALCVGRWPLLQSAAILLCMAALGAVRSSTVRQQHDAVAWPDKAVCYEAVVVSEVTEKPKTMAADVMIAGSGKKLKCYIKKDDRSRRLTIGDRLRVTSRIGRNSTWQRGTFDYRRYLEVHGFAGQTFVRADNWQLLAPSWHGIGTWQQLKLRFLTFRHGLLQHYRQAGIEREEYAVVAAMTLGDKSVMTRELRDVYAVSGASHVLALSGLHLGMIYMLLSLLTVGRRRRVLSQLIIILSIWAFALLVGLPLSVVRSAVMISVYALVSLTGRGHMSVNALSLAALIILLVSPDSLFDVGFQLSFASMLAILLLLPLFECLINAEWLFGRPLLKRLWGLTTVSVAAQVGTAPLVAYYFGRFSTWFLLTNIVVVPAVTLILCLALASLLLPVVSTALVSIVGWLNVFLSFVANRLPCASIEGLHPSALQTAMVYVIIISVYLIIIRYDKRF